MARSIAFLPISFSLWMAMSGIASGQAIMESGLGAARAATTAAPAKGVGKSLSGLAGSLEKAIKAQSPGSVEQPSRGRYKRGSPNPASGSQHSAPGSELGRSGRDRGRHHLR